MRQTIRIRKSPGEKIFKGIKRATRENYCSEENVWIVCDGLSGADSIAELCRREGIYYKWAKDFIKVEEKRQVADTARAATTDKVKALIEYCYIIAQC